MKATELIVKCMETDDQPLLVLNAESFGANGISIGSADELAPALRTGLEANKLTIIDCPVDASENLRLSQKLGVSP
ncbi:MAG: hypothetical protein P8173_16395 [Gammaproteobacteria bacterium]